MFSLTPRVTARLRRGTVATLIASSLLLGASIVPSNAVSTAVSSLTSSWLAAQVGPDGQVNISGSTQSVVTQTMYVAQGLAASGEHRGALDRAMAFLSLGSSIEEWVTNDGSGGTVAPAGSDLPERLASLILLVRTTRGNPRAFGEPATDLVSRAEAMYSEVVPGFYGYQEPYSSVQDQSMMVIALQSVGATPPNAAVEWIVDQQCIGGSNPAAALGGWQSFRNSTGSDLDDCDAPDPLNYLGADTNSTAFAIQALQLFGRTEPIPAALNFLQQAQSPDGSAIAGFPWFTGGEADPNSTALVLQAITSIGQAPSAWAISGSNPLLALQTFQLKSPTSDAGAFYASWNPGVPDLLSTYQGVWGLTLTAFPFPVLPEVGPAEPESIPTFTG